MALLGFNGLLLSAQMRCVSSLHKKRRAEEDEEWSSQDMKSMEYNYV